MNLFTLHNLRFKFESNEVLHGINLQLQSREMMVIVGPNGAGKSTLMSVLSGYYNRYEGSCSFLDVDLREWNKRELGRRLSFIPQ